MANDSGLITRLRMVVARDAASPCRDAWLVAQASGDQTPSNLCVADEVDCLLESVFMVGNAVTGGVKGRLRRNRL